MRILLGLFLFSIRVFGQHSNVTISNAATSNGVWTLVGTVNTFTPTADNANVNVADLNNSNGKFANDRSVEIKTACAQGTQYGTILVNIGINPNPTSTVARKFTLNAGGDLVVNQQVELGGNISTTNKGIELYFSCGGNMQVNQILSTSTYGPFTYSPQPSPNISLIANGTFYLASGVIINSSGASSSNSSGGWAGKITISGLSGVSILGTLNALGGSSNLGPNTLAYFGPSNDVEITTNHLLATTGGANDGLAGGTIKCGGLVKNGVGILSLAGSYEVLSLSAGSLALYLTINSGIVRLTNSATVYRLYLNAPTAVFEFGIVNQEIYDLYGQGIIRKYQTGNGAIRLGYWIDNERTFSGKIQDGDGIVQVIINARNNGSIKFTGANSYTGITELFQGGLILGASNVISDVSHIKFNGGILKTLGFNEVLGSIHLTTNSQIYLSSGVHQLTFSSIGTLAGGRILEIRGWQGDVNGQSSNVTQYGMLYKSSSTFVSKHGVIQSKAGINHFGQISLGGIPSLAGKIVINGSLSSTQLGQFKFVKTSDQSVHDASQLSDNELVSDF